MRETRVVDSRRGWRGFWIQLARKGPMRNLLCDRCALMSQVYTQTYG